MRPVADGYTRWKQSSLKKIGLSASVAAPVHFPSVPQLARHESVDTPW